jgi:hypothetical protein
MNGRMPDDALATSKELATPLLVHRYSLAKGLNALVSWQEVLCGDSI